MTQAIENKLQAPMDQLQIWFQMAVTCHLQIQQLNGITYQCPLHVLPSVSDLRSGLKAIVS